MEHMRARKGAELAVAFNILILIVLQQASSRYVATSERGIVGDSVSN